MQQGRPIRFVGVGHSLAPGGECHWLASAACDGRGAWSLPCAVVDGCKLEDAATLPTGELCWIWDMFSLMCQTVENTLENAHVWKRLHMYENACCLRERFPCGAPCGAQFG